MDFGISSTIKKYKTLSFLYVGFVGSYILKKKAYSLVTSYLSQYNVDCFS